MSPKRHKLSVGDKKLSSAPAPEQVPELQLFANLTVEEGAPPLSYWEGLYDQLKKVGCELDFPEIEERVFNCLVLGPVAMGKAENGRLLSFFPPPLLFIGMDEIEARVPAAAFVFPAVQGARPEALQRTHTRGPGR